MIWGFLLLQRLTMMSVLQFEKLGYAFGERNRDRIRNYLYDALARVSVVSEQRFCSLTDLVVVVRFAYDCQDLHVELQHCTKNTTVCGETQTDKYVLNRKEISGIATLTVNATAWTRRTHALLYIANGRMRLIYVSTRLSNSVMLLLTPAPHYNNPCHVLQALLTPSADHTII